MPAKKPFSKTCDLLKCLLFRFAGLLRCQRSECSCQRSCVLRVACRGEKTQKQDRLLQQGSRSGKTDTETCPIYHLNRYLEQAGLYQLPDNFIFRRLQYTKKGLRLCLKNVPMSYVSARDQLERYLKSSGLNPKLLDFIVFGQEVRPRKPKTEFAKVHSKNTVAGSLKRLKMAMPEKY